MLLVGPTVPVPASGQLAEALSDVEVTHDDTGQSGFQLRFRSGRSSEADLVDHPLLMNPLLRLFNRVVLVVIFDVVPRVLMDGIITTIELQPGNEPGTSMLTVTGEDVSVLLDQQEKSEEHLGLDETLIAYKIIFSYPQFQLIPMVIPPPVVDPPLAIERVPVQNDTDLGYLMDLAGRHGYVFYITPGPAPLTNTAYWGPPVRLGIPQKALSVNMGAETNVEQLSFQHNGREVAMMEGQVQDRITNQSMPVQTFFSARPPLASQPTWLIHNAQIRRRRQRFSGLNYLQAMARAQGAMESSTDVVTGQGELDALRYGDLLQPRGLVGVRGAGYSYDGFYYVKRVTHNLRRGEYKQRFVLAREGLGSTTPVVRP